MPDEEATGRAFKLLGQERTLHEALLVRAPNVATIYLGALHVFKDDVNPDHLALAAHGIREMLDKIPEVLDVPAQALRESMTVEVRNVEVVWDKAISESSCRQKDDWSGTIDASARRLLRSVDRFFVWLKEHHPRRKAATADTLRRMDPSGRDVSPALRDHNIEAWQAMHDFFVDVLHHRKIVTRETFQERLSALERFLLDRLSPRTFEDIEAIDSILEEAKRDD